MDTQLYELRYALYSVSESAVQAVEESYDAIFYSAFDTCGATLLAEGTDAVDVALTTARHLDRLDAKVERLVPDLVTRNEIAERFGVTRQTAHNWSSGDRREGFPAPRIVSAAPLWYWPDLVDWSRVHNVAGNPDNDVTFPTFDQVDVINALRRSPGRVEQTTEPTGSRYSGPVTRISSISPGEGQSTAMPEWKRVFSSVSVTTTTGGRRDVARIRGWAADTGHLSKGVRLT